MTDSVKKTLDEMGNTSFQNLLNFKGYGNIEAPIWFIGVEEAVEIKEVNLKDYQDEIACSPKHTFETNPRQQIYQIID